jgi:hypothetical protein
MDMKNKIVSNAITSQLEISHTIPVFFRHSYTNGHFRYTSTGLPLEEVGYTTAPTGFYPT